MNRALETCTQDQIHEDAHNAGPTKVTGKKLEKIMAENFPNFMKHLSRDQKHSTTQIR